MRQPDPERVFADRSDAGAQLAEMLLGYRNENPIVFALPRGGVMVGYEVAIALSAPLDVVVAHKIGAPYQPEFAIGAVGPNGICVLDRNAIAEFDIPDEHLQAMVAAEKAEVERRIRHYAGDREALSPRDQTAILVDDGIATGMTVRAATRYLRTRRPRRLVLAAPVCAWATAVALRSQVDDTVFVWTPYAFGAVAEWYDDFRQVSDAEVVALLARAHAGAEGRFPCRRTRS